jgi:hypothetical protein
VLKSLSRSIKILIVVLLINFAVPFSSPSSAWKFWEKKEEKKRDYGQLLNEKNLEDNKILRLANEILIDKKEAGTKQEYHLRLHVFPTVNPKFIIVKLYYDELYDAEPEALNWIHDDKTFPPDFTDNDNPALAYERILENKRNYVLEYAFYKNKVLGIDEDSEKEVQEAKKKEPKKQWTFKKKKKEEEILEKNLIEVKWKTGDVSRVDISDKLYSTAEFIRPDSYPHWQDEEYKKDLQEEFMPDPSLKQDFDTNLEL